MSDRPLPRAPERAPVCALCGYPSAHASRCATCGFPDAGTLAPAGRARALGLALVALPRGLALLARTPGTKRLLLPPLLLTTGAIVLLLAWAFRTLRDLAERARPDEFDLTSWEWIQSLPATWSWVTAVWNALAGAVEWLVGALVSFLLAEPSQLLVVLLVGSLVVWYGASIVFEALAGPFLDEIQARVEARWYGEDPRARLERPEGLSSEDALRRTSLAAGLGVALAAGLYFAGGVGLWLSIASLPLGLLLPLALGGGYATWMRWFLRVEARALWTGIQGAAFSLVILVLALPLYFVPVVGYFLYAAATGVATATSLLDIPLERRGWSLRGRVRLLGRFLPAWILFGVLAGLLLAVPLIGPLLFVPTTSLGGLWLLARVDKGGLDTARPGPAERAPRDAALRPREPAG